VIDTHAHLDACDADPEDLLARARSAGVSRVVTIGTGIGSCRRAVAIAAAHDGVVAALGIDPHQAATPEAGRIGELRVLLAEPRVVAVGETGLDGHHGADTLREQRTLLDAHLALAEELGLPVVIHSRAASAETAAALAPFGGTVVLHCFSEPELLEPAVEQRYYVSFAGNVTYPKADALRSAAAQVPADRILAETDSPYLSPQPVRGRRNEPANVIHTLAVLAAEREETASELEMRIDENADHAFGLGRL
jgi:TatD DNase family protein